MHSNRLYIILSLLIIQICCEIEKQSNVSTTDAQPIVEATIIEVKRETHQAAINDAIDAPNAKLARRSVADDDEAAVLLKQTIDDPENSSVTAEARQKRRTVRKMTKARTKSLKHKNTSASSNVIP